MDIGDIKGGCMVSWDLYHNTGFVALISELVLPLLSIQYF